MEDKHGWCHIQCLNASMYTEWLHKSTFTFGHQIDSIPCKENIDNTEPNKTAIQLALAPTRETIAQNVQAMNNAMAFTLMNFKKVFTIIMKESVDMVDGKLATLAKNMNLDTCRRMKELTKTHISRM